MTAATPLQPEIVAEHDYHDERGELLFQVVRRPEKRFVQRRPDGHGGWTWGLGETRRVVFRLPPLLEHIGSGSREPVYVAEGEKDVEALVAAGAVATCNPMGALKWSDDYSESFMGARSVVIVADRDEPGREHALAVRESLARVAGVPSADISIVEAAEGKDAADHLAAGRSLAEFVPVVLDDNEPAPVEAFALRVTTARGFACLPEPDELSLLLGPLVRRGERTIIVGDTGHGKTTLALQLAAGVLTGADVLGYQGATAGPVLWLDLEQGVRSIKRGLREAGLDAREDVLVVSVPDGLALGSEAEHDAELARVVRAHRPAVVLLDPFYKAHRADDPNAERPIIDLMRRLDALRAEHGFALLLPAHPRKDVPGRDGPRKLTLHDVAGSGALTRGAEVVLGIERLSHGYARLRVLKDRDGDLQVGDAWPLVYDRERGFRLDPKEELADEIVEQRVREEVDAGALRTVREWAVELGIRQTRARDTLERLAEAGELSIVVGPPGRSPRARCYGTVPETPEQSGSVGSSEVGGELLPLLPPSLEDGGSGSSEATASGAGAVEEEDRLGGEDIQWR
jgi:archaellum biogenesis ATPase FlaH